MVWINEFHYDSPGSDRNEFIEIAGLAGTDLTGWFISLIDGFNGTNYRIFPLEGTIIDDEGSGFGAVSFDTFSIQNGSPDGIVLFENPVTVHEFISYEGSFTANNGVAVGLMSTDIGVQQTGITPLGMTLQLTGTGDKASDFSWVGPVTWSPGSLNAGQTLLCFAAGTKIMGPFGETPVQQLKIGDVLLTQNGTLSRVKWIGHQTVNKLLSGPRMQPVRIAAGALGNGLPHSDLTVTADHGMVLDGYVINASALVNGTSIDFVPMNALPDSFTLYHIETENHDVILANGAPSETFVDAASRAHFDNHQEYLDLYGVERIIPEMQRPRISTQRLLPSALRDRRAPKPLKHTNSA